MHGKYSLKTNDTGIELQERTVHKNIQKEQKDVLIKAVDSYLHWRAHESDSDARGYESGYFTWLRHFTDFGKNRAEAFKNKLSEEKNCTIALLKEHFKKNSRISNHSLDTYILEGIFNKKTLFLHWFPNDSGLADLKKLDESHRSVLRTCIIESNSSSEYAEQYLATAKKYDEGEGVANKANALRFYEKASDYGNSSAAVLLAQHHQIAPNELSEEKTATAFHFYLEAAKLGHPDALPSLERLADEMSAEKQRELSQLYGSFFNNPEKANYWRTKAKEVEQFNFNM